MRIVPLAVGLLVGCGVSTSAPRPNPAPAPLQRAPASAAVDARAVGADGSELWLLSGTEVVWVPTSLDSIVEVVWLDCGVTVAARTNRDVVALSLTREVLGHTRVPNLNQALREQLAAMVAQSAEEAPEDDSEQALSSATATPGRLVVGEGGLRIIPLIDETHHHAEHDGCPHFVAELAVDFPLDGIEARACSATERVPWNSPPPATPWCSTATMARPWNSRSDDLSRLGACHPRLHGMLAGVLPKVADRHGQSDTAAPREASYGHIRAICTSVPAQVMSTASTWPFSVVRSATRRPMAKVGVPPSDSSRPAGRALKSLSSMIWVTAPPSATTHSWWQASSCHAPETARGPL